MVFRVSLKLTPSAVNKFLKASEVFSDKSFKIRPCDENSALVAALMLSPTNANRATEEWGYKQGIICSSGAWYFEIIFTLLIEVVIFYIKLTPINLWGPAFNWCFCGSVFACVVSMNTIMNFVNRFLAGRGIKDGVGVSKKIGALSLPASDFAPASSSYFPEILAGKLIQGLCRVMWDFRAIVRDWDLNVILSNRLADPLDIKLLKL